MSAVTELNLDDLPDSPHARELRRGLDQLRFAPELEHAYIQQRLDSARTRLRCFAVVAFALGIGFSLAAYARDGRWSATVAVHLLLIVPITLVLVWQVLSRHFSRWYLPTSQVIAPALSALSGILSAESIAHGAVEDLAIPPLVMIAIFLFMGLLFRAALVTGIVTLLAFSVAGLAFDLPAEVFMKGVLLLSATGVVAAIIGRDAELHQRQRFLEEALIAELVERDGLTGLKNRRTFDAHLQRVWQHCVRERRVLGLLFMDIDYFKRYNDKYGHQAGDAALRRVGQAALACARRPFDMAARFGGEEFCVVLYDTPAPDVAAVADQLRRGVEQLRIEHRASGCSDVVTVSVGVAVLHPTANRTPQDALHLADEALYRAKGAGRNRCEILTATEQLELTFSVREN